MKNPWIGMLLGSVSAALLAGAAWGQTPGGDAKKSAHLEGDIKALSSRIDQLIDLKMQQAGIRPAALTDHAAFFRRVHLDLVGKIPDLPKIRDLLDEDYAPEPRRWTRVEELINSEQFVKHFANVLRAQMITTDNNFQVLGLLPSFELWLQDHLQKNHGYDVIVRELLTGQPFGNGQPFQFGGGGMAANGSPAAFYFSNENKPENLAGATARLFLGVKLECAQCHAHPFAKWTRNQFWEFAAFYSGIQQQFRQNGVQPANVGAREIMIPGTQKVVKAKFLNGADPAWKDGSDSRRVLADWITSKENPYFAKASVDMVWQYFFGTSLLEPILEPHDDAAVTHPELLDELAREFTAHGYDLRFLIRAIVNSNAYQRSSVPGSEPGPADLQFFARMPVRGLSPEQLFDSVAEAIEYKEVGAQPVRNQFGNVPATPRAEFLAKFTASERRTEMQTSILQALFLMNGKFLTKWTTLDPSMTQEKLYQLQVSGTGAGANINVGLHNLAIQPTSSAGKIDTLYLWVLSRHPRPEETARLVRYLDWEAPAYAAARDGRLVNLTLARTAALATPGFGTLAFPSVGLLADSMIAGAASSRPVADVYWALLNSGEFMLNH